MLTFTIRSPSRQWQSELQNVIDTKTKPVGALGDLEEIALKIGLIQNTLTPQLQRPHILVFAADHGAAAAAISAYPQEVTYQMVMNFLQGGAAINVFSRQNGLAMKIIDAGVNGDFPPGLDLIRAKVAKGTKNFLNEKAMTPKQFDEAIAKGAEIVSVVAREGCNIVGFGEMGIGNTSSASLLMSHFCHQPVSECVGRGTGLDDAQLNHKIKLLEAAKNNFNINPSDTREVLTVFGGFEIVMMCGAMLRAAELSMVILIDGFITTAAYTAAYRFNAGIKDFTFFCHQSGEYGHAGMLKFLGGKPILNLNMRLGEGTAVAVAYPVIEAAVRFLNDMASFQSAGVSRKKES